SDLIPANATYDTSSATVGTTMFDAPHSKVVASLGDLVSGATATITVKLKAGDSGIINTTISANVDPNQNTDRDTSNNSAPLRGNVPQGDVAIAMASVTPQTVFLNQNLTYKFIVASNGPAAAPGVTFSDPIPSGTTLVSASDERGTSFTNMGGTITG